MSKRLVLDTNVVFDLLHFDDPAVRPLRHALATGRAHCVVSTATLDEWRRVLAYPAFHLSPARQAALLDGYTQLAQRTDVPAPAPPLPRCRDADDQKFLELAAAAGAHALVSKDRALLRLRRRCTSRFEILDPAGVGRWLAA